MGTRGVVAVRQEDGGWLGVYNHWDSYPTGLGEDVFEATKEIPANQLQNWCLALLKNDDWREFVNEGECEYCGIVGLGQPHTICVGEMVEGQKHLRTGAAVPEHQHTRDEGGDFKHITDKDFEDSWCEWAYVIDPFKREIEVISKYYGSQGKHSIDAEFDAKVVEKAAYGDEDEDE
jgi:hypothetical protein